MYDTMYYGRLFRIINAIDESNREVLAIEINLSMPAASVIKILEQLEEIHGSANVWCAIYPIPWLCRSALTK